MDHSTCQCPRTWPVGAVYGFCRDRSLDFTTAVNTAWAIVLWEYTGEEVIVFPSQSITHDTHTWTRCESVVDWTSTFSSVLQSVRNSTGQVSTPTTNLPPSQGTPLLNTVTVFTSGNSCCTIPVGDTHLTGLVCNLSETTVDCAVRFVPGVIDAKQAERLASAFAHIMGLLLSGTNEMLASIDIVSDHDKAELWTWNNAQTPETVNSCAHVLFQRQVYQQPDALAVDAWDGSFTYKELDRISTLIAHHLVAQGVGPESAVPLCFDKSCWAIAALMGVIKAGGAMVFIDPANPASRRREIISQLNSDYVLTNAAHAASWESMGIRPIIIDSSLIDCLREFGASPRTGVTPESLLYIIFTSGTTSKPKGCLITHKAFLSGALQHAAKSNLGPRSRVMQLASYSFDVSVLEILTSLISGACVCTPDSAAMTQGLANIINSYQITWAFLTPSLVKLVEPYQVPTLQTLILGGESLHRADIANWASHLQLVNGYGPSECSIAAAGDPHLTPESDPANIGRSVGGLAWIVRSDDHDKLVPIGAIGELLISGPILARGYLSNPQQTAQAFIDDPLWTRSLPKGTAHVKRFYKTGDLAKFNSDGTIHFIGRKDTQVKLRGMRIELGEIEYSIAQHQHVKHIAVSLPKSGSCKEKLVAVLSLHEFSHEAPAGVTSAPVVVVMSPEATAQLDAVRRDLASRVPDYMIPAVWIIIETWPLLTSAKLDRKRVKEWLLDMNDDIYHGLIGVAGIQARDSQASSTKHKLRNIISRVLNMPADLIPSEKSFLGLGGDSITAMQVMAQCRNEGISITAKDILRSKSIAELVVCSREVVKSSFAKDEKFDHSFQLSPVQRMYANKLRAVHEELPEVHFNQSFYIRIAKPVPRSVIKAGLDAIVSRQSMLRARFVPGSGSWTQKVLSGADGSYRFKCHCLRSLEDAGPVAMIAQRLLGLAGPVFSVDLFQLEEQQYLFMVAHHAVIDWVSWRIILRDLEIFISTGALGGEPPLPFQNWINLQAEHSAKYGDPDKVLPFEVPPPDFVFWDMVGKPNTLSDTTSITFNLSKILTAQLLGGEPHRALRTEVLDFLLASLLYSFGQVFKDRPLPGIFREGHGREPWDAALNLSDTVGWFTTMYPLAIDADSLDGMISILKKVKDVRHSVPDNGRPYFASRFHNERAAQKFQDHDQIEIAFDYLGQFQALERPDAFLRQEARPSFLPQADDVGKNLDRLSLIEITAEVMDGQMQYTFVYNKHMKHQDRIQAWTAATQHALNDMVARMLTAPLDFTLADFPLLSMSYEDLDNLLGERLAKAGFEDLENVEEIYPCSPMQNGLLFSQSLSSDGVYEYRHQIEVTPSDSSHLIDADRLASAWARVVQQHSCLRTVFIESSAQDGLFNQVVLKSITPEIVITTCSEQDIARIFQSQQPISYRSRKPPHRLTIARVAPDTLIGQLEINHAIVDGSSIANIVHDICRVYEGSLTTQPTFQFSDYIEFIQDSDVSASTDFWKKYLEGQNPCLFPGLAQLEGPVGEKALGNRDVDIDISPEALKTFCERLNVTPLSLFQVAWGMVLKVYTESTRVCFGYLSSGRDVTLPGIENGVGPFLTMLVCSLDFSGGKLSDVLQETAEDLMKCLPHQHCGLANIQHSLEMGNTPLFNTILSFHRDDHIPEIKGSGIAIKSLKAQDPTEYALGIDIGLFKDTLEVSMQFWTDHITKEQISSIASTFNKVLSSIVRYPDADPGKLELASQYHIDKMIQFNGNGEPLPSSQRLMFADIERNAYSQPEAEAICSWDGSWTYKELDDVTNRLGHYLRSVGVGPEVVVPHLFHKSAWAIITMISILKAGGAIVGLDWAHPRRRLESLITEVDAAVVCVSSETADIVRGMARVKKLIVIDAEFVNKLPAKNGPPCTEVRPYNLACVVFSSGTTSKPKTIAMEHSSMSTMTDLLGPPFKLGRHSRVFQFAAYAYDTSNHDIFVTLQRGGCVCVPSEDERMNDPASAIRRMNANWAALTPTVARLLRPNQVPSLKFISCGGEPLDRELVGTWAGTVDLVNGMMPLLHSNPSNVDWLMLVDVLTLTPQGKYLSTMLIRYFTGYGPAETAVSSSLSAPLTLDSSSSNIGPSYGARAWIVDVEDYNRLVPLGAAGELLLEGPQLARCYLNNNEMTAKAFIYNPRWAQVMTPGLKRRFYRTGDICRFNTDGTLSIMGRRDTMVKVNGQRVELEGVTYQIQSQLGKKAAVVVDALPLETSSRSLTLVAFLCYQEPRAPSTNDRNCLALDADDELSLQHIALRSVLESRLPRYMVPSVFIPIAEIPRTRNGKLDRNRMREEVLQLSESQMAQYSLQNVGKRAPETTTEVLLQTLWSEVLRRPAETFGLNDDFFRAGGDSFGAMKLVAAARARNMMITVPDIFKSPRLSDMALRLCAESGDGDSTTSQSFDLLSGLDPDTLDKIKAEAAEQCGIPSQEIVDLYPCTALQEGLMALSTRLGKGAYKAQKVFRITSDEFDISCFKAAWNTVATSEAILRTRIIHTKAAGTLQAVLNAGPEWYETEEDLDGYLTQDMKTPVAYGGPLLRFALVNNANACYFVWSAHHAVYDAWSARIALSQVRQVLTGVQMDSKSVPFKGFIRHLTQIDATAQCAFWESQFPENKTPPLSFPSVPIGFQTQTHETLKQGLSTRVKCADGLNITASTILRAAWASVISKYSGHKDVVFGATLSGRTANVAGISTMNGPTITTVPVRIELDLPGETTIYQYLNAVQGQATDMVPFEQMGLQNIRRQGNTVRIALDSITNLLVIQPSDFEGDQNLNGIEAVPRSLDEFDSYPLVVLCSISDDGTTTLEVKYDQSIISRKQMHRIARHYDFTLQQLCSKPYTRLSDIDAINPEDMNEILEWNSPLPETTKACIHHVIAARTEERPNAHAVCAWDGNFTYGELNSISIRLAAHLQGLGVGPEVKVGLCFEKSKWNVVAMLSVLMAGGTYTQLNPSNPRPLMKGILDDLGASTILCSSPQAALLADVVQSVLVLDSNFIDNLPMPLEPVRSNSRPDSSAFIVYTSGSTGKPKGVIVEHRGFCSMAQYQAPRLGIGKNTRTLQFAAHWFDISNADAFITLMRGGCVCIPSEDERLSNLAGAINKYQVNWATMVPTAAAILQPDEVPTLKHLSLGGEPVRSDLHLRWSRHVVLMNSYGPAECSVLTTMGSLTPDVSPQNIGVGLGCRTWVTEKDDHNRLMSIGCVGELCVEGPIVTRGYHNNETMTAEAYITNPEFAKQLGLPNMRIYKTGDLVRYESDGSLFIIGRKDTQIKIHGRRIECGEVEHHIVANGFPVGCVVVERIYEGGDETRPVLAAFIKLGSSANNVHQERQLAIELSADDKSRLSDLRQTLGSLVQPYMVPTLFVALQDIPLTQTGKKDRKRLRSLGTELSPSQLEQYRLDDAVPGENGGLTCSTASELQLRALWEEVLGLAPESIHAYDNFLQKGGDSIRAIALTSAARRAGKTLTVSDIFRYPRLHEMAKCFKNEEAAIDQDISPFALISETTMMIDHAAQECNVDKEIIQDIYPCTPLQEGLMAISTRVPDAYVATRVFDIPQSIDLDAFKQAWESAVEMFPILRTRIILGPEMESLQVVLNEKLAWGEISGSVKTYLARSGLSHIEYGRPLSSYAISTRSRKFVWISHHALYDGFSAAKLLSTVEMLYGGKSVPATPNFNQFIQYLAHVDMADSDDFWRERLSGNSPCSFPRLPSFGYKPQPNSEFLCSFTLPHNKTSGILKATVLRAAWNLVTARYMESNHIVYGETLAGRNVPVAGIEDMMAPCFTTVPIRVDIDHHQSVGRYLNQIQEDYTAMISFQHRGLQSLRSLGPEIHESLELNSLFEVHDGGSRQSDNFLVEIQEKQLLKGFFDSYAVVMECIVVDCQTVKIEARYDANVLDDWQMERLCGHFRHVADQLCTVDHDNTLYDIEIITPDDMAIIQHWNERDDMQCFESTIQDVFAQQVRLRPQDLAISAWDGEMIYEELDDLSTRVAQNLVSRGVRPEDIVPMCFEKSKWAIVTMLGIVKAGGAVVQLGISHPQGLKRDILQDTDAKLVVASRQQQASFDGLIDVLVVDQQTIHDLAQEKSHLPQVSPSNAAYVLFTSGSTGRSKGIVVEHLNICTSSRHHGAHLGINAGTRVFQFAAYTFDISCADIFTSLQRGATICIPSEEERVNDLSGAITKYSANWVFLTPTVAQMVSPTSVPTLRTLALGGEAPTEDNIKTWSHHLRLILIWGPAETTIYATSTSSTTIDTSPTELGHAMGCHLWLCEPDDHNKLTPVGCVGEIVVEGSLVSRGYLKNKTQTTASYFQDPLWTKINSGDSKPRRMYKTGDLARWGADGVLRYIGRKDNQVKLHGQRFELEDVEHRISLHACVRHAVTRIPRIGPFKDKLVATLSYHNNPASQNTTTSSIGSGAETPTLLNCRSLAAIEVDLSNIRQDLEDTLPSYQCPSVWINVEAIPLNNNGKIDRKAVNKWLEEMDEEAFELLTQGSSDHQLGAIPSTREEQILATLVGRVLNIQNPNVKRSFLSLGGDSITAMQLRAKARAEGVDLTVQDILKSKSLSALAVTVKSSATTLVKREREEIGVSFGLSPIQKLFFDTAKSTKHFNQSFVLKINSTTLPCKLEAAMETLVSRHSMLRARFHTSNGTWFQSITDKIQDSFTFRVDEVDSRGQVGEILSKRNDFNMDIGNGPLLVAHLFQVTKGTEQLLFLSAHHLVVDLVSWRIILNDLQELLNTGTLLSEPPLSFQNWLHLQQEHSRSLIVDAVLPVRTTSDFGYWGMDGQPNVFGDISTSNLTLSETLTAKIFGSSNVALNTEPVDIILAAIIHSFQSVFTDRDVPPVFIEGHGRETWSDDVDPNGTVGWFTTMKPLHVTSTQSEIVQVVRSTKDLRCKTGSQMSYLSSLFVTEEDGQQQSRNDSRVELLFNYLGKYQQLESKDAFFSQIDLECDAVAASQFDPKLERFSLIDISVVVTHGQARIQFTYDKKMRHQDKLQQWTSIFQDSIIRATDALEDMNQQRTVGDFSLLPDLDEEKFVSLKKGLAVGGISIDNVQDIFPCAPLQQHMIDAQEEGQGCGLYEVSVYQQVLAGRAPPFNDPVDIRVLQEAWKKVVDYHAILRTIFIPSSVRPGQHDQAVLSSSSYSADIPIITCGDESDLFRRIKSHKSLDCHDQTTSEKRPHNRFTLFTTGDGRKTACKLEISHVLIDGMSVSVLFRDLASAYHGRLGTKQASEKPYFGDYIAWLTKQTTRDSVKYWRQLIASSSHSFAASSKKQQYHPLQLRPEGPHRREQKFLNISLNPALVAVIPSFCQFHGVTVATFFQTVWGLVLRQCLTRSGDAPLFGYMVANRDAAVHAAEDIVGPMTAMLLCRAECKPATRVGDLLRRTQGEVLEAMQHHSALADAVRDMEMEYDNDIEEKGRKGRKFKLCSSVMSLQYMDAGSDVVPRRAAAGPPRMKTANCEPLRVNNTKKNANMVLKRSQIPAPKVKKDSDIKFRLLGYHDPNEYDMSVGVQVVRSGNRIENNLKVNVGFVYWTDALRDAKARSVVKAFQRCAEELIENGSNGLRIWMLMRRLG